MSNLIDNPGFETNTTGWTAAGAGTIARVTDVFRSGVASAFRDIVADGNSSNFKDITISASTLYYVEAWVKQDVATGDFRIGWNEHQAGGGPYITTRQATWNDVGTDWAKITHSATSASNAGTLKFFLARHNTTDDFHHDDMWVGTDPSPPPSGPDTGLAWFTA